MLATMTSFAWSGPKDECRHPRSGDTAPPLLAPAFQVMGSKNYEPEASGAGCAIRFEHSSGLWVDVFIYRAGLGVIDDRPRDERLMKEFQGAMRAVVQSWETQDGGKVRDANASYAERGRLSVEVMAGQATINTAQQGTLRTHVVVWGGSGAIWKIRATYPIGEPGMSDAVVEALSHVIVDWSREDS
jgi:hypothetical protein